MNLPDSTRPFQPPTWRTPTTRTAAAPTTTARSGDNERPSHQPPTGWGDERKSSTLTHNHTDTEPRNGDGSTGTSKQKRLPAVAEERGKSFRFAATAPLVARNPTTHEHHFFFLPVALVEGNGKTIITYARTRDAHTKLEDRWNLINDYSNEPTDDYRLLSTRTGSTRLFIGVSHGPHSLGRRARCCTVGAWTELMRNRSESQCRHIARLQ